ncbi:discoidin domain-containing protein [Lysinibacillus sphaericus]|uniref:discoidin domain-containing protein n=1 Tax=Lysinibacillus sphaericus TaxID=1421 RepID=UPI00259FFC45|nr:discoidin domain-containing protein [Lysinibacillus sphaericus]MDM5349681.1 discoidin domain-containing protein [Lysinibacillus sphaericus]
MKKFLLMFLVSIPFFIFSTIGDAHAATGNPTSLVPKMTADNAPSGKATSSSEWFKPYLAFDGVPDYASNGGFHAWGTSQTTGWLAYEFDQPKILTKYVLFYGKHQSSNPGYTFNLPNSWTFEGSNDGVNWVELDKVNDYTTWEDGENTFTISNNQPFKHFRINVTKNNGSVSNQVNLTIHELQLWGYDSTEKPNPEPNPEPKPDPTPEQNRAILVISLITGIEKEYDLSLEEVNSFINWYEFTTGEKSYAINRTNKNKGPFKSRKDYFVHDKILMYEVSEY